MTNMRVINLLQAATGRMGGRTSAFIIPMGSFVEDMMEENMMIQGWLTM
jgi:hypothetical protein